MAEEIFQDWPVLVTGAGSGIGLACVRRLARRGARLLLVGRRMEPLAAALAELPGAGHQAAAADAADEAALASVVKTFVEAAGPLRGAVNGAGAHLLRPLAVCAAAHFEAQFRANALTAAVTARVWAKYAAKDGASLVFISSAAAWRGGATASAYAAAKGAVLALARALAVELAPRRLRVNTVVPGVVRTPMSAQFLGGLSPAQALAVEQAHPLGLGEPDDVAAAIAFLLSPDARWITGAELVVDGGFLCR